MLRRSFRPLCLRVRAACAAGLAMLALLGGCFPDGVTDEDFESRRVIVAVHTQADQPVAGADVAWWPLGLQDDSFNAVGETGTDGRVTFDVSLWTDIAIEITLPAGYTVADGQNNPVNVTLSEITTVTFRVVAQ